MLCKKCQQEYPSKYYFVTESICQECFNKLKKSEKQRILEEKDSLEKEEASERIVEGHKLKCPVCGFNKFWKRKTLMNTPGMTLIGIEWANKQAINYVCDSCNYVMWFLHDQ
jgi:hypothetical protein